MADQPSFLDGLMSGLNGLGQNPLFNIGMGLMSAAKPYGNVGDSLMQANQTTMANQSAAQKYGMGQLQMRQAQAEFPMRMAWLKNAMGSLQPQQAPQQQPQAPMQAPPGIALPPDPNAAPQGAPQSQGGFMDPTQAVNLGLSGGALGMPGAAEFLKVPGAMESVQKYQQMQRQMAAQGPLATLDTLATSDKADQLINADPHLKAAWTQIAPQMGMDPDKDLNPANGRSMATFAYNKLAGPAGLPVKPMPVQVQRVDRGNGDVRDIDPLTNKDVGGSPAMATSKFVQNGQVVEMPTAQGVAQKLQPYDSALYGAQQITQPAMEQAYQVAKAKGDLSESLAGRDPIAAAKVSSYIAKRAGEDGISGLQLAANQQTFGARQKVVNDFMDPNGTAGGKIGAINTGILHVNSLMPLIDAMKSGNTTRINAARQTYQKETGIPAPTNYETLANMAVGEISTAINKSGGDAEERDRVASPFASSRSPDVLKGAVKTAVTALAGKTESLANQWDVGTEGTQGNFGKFLMPQTAQALGWTLHKDAKGNKAYVSPDGKYFRPQ